MTTVLYKRNSTQFQNGISSDLFDVPNELGLGVYQSPLSYYEIIPLTPSADCIVDAQTPTAGVAVTLNSDPTNASYILYNGAYAIKLDCPRGVYATSTSNQTSDQVIQITGYDSLAQYMVKTITIPDGDAQSNNSYFAFELVTSVEVLSGSSTSFQGTLSVGTNALIGLPFHGLNRVHYVLSCWWNNSQLTPTSTTSPTISEIGIIDMNNWRVVTDATTTVSGVPSLISADPRGMAVLPTNPTGSAVFNILYAPYGADANLQALLRNNQYTAYTLLQQSASPSVEGTPQPADTPPYLLTSLDLTGVQYGYTYDAEGTLVWTPQMLAYFKAMNTTVPTSI